MKNLAFVESKGLRDSERQYRQLVCGGLTRARVQDDRTDRKYAISTLSETKGCSIPSPGVENNETDMKIKIHGIKYYTL